MHPVGRDDLLPLPKSRIPKRKHSSPNKQKINQPPQNEHNNHGILPAHEASTSRNEDFPTSIKPAKAKVPRLTPRPKSKSGPGPGHQEPLMEEFRERAKELIEEETQRLKKKINPFTPDAVQLTVNKRKFHEDDDGKQDEDDVHVPSSIQPATSNERPVPSMMKIPTVEQLAKKLQDFNSMAPVQKAVRLRSLLFISPQSRCVKMQVKELKRILGYENEPDGSTLRELISKLARPKDTEMVSPDPDVSINAPFRNGGLLADPVPRIPLLAEPAGPRLPPSPPESARFHRSRDRKPEIDAQPKPIKAVRKSTMKPKKIPTQEAINNKLQEVHKLDPRMKGFRLKTLLKIKPEERSMIVDIQIKELKRALGYEDESDENTLQDLFRNFDHKELYQSGLDPNIPGSSSVMTGIGPLVPMSIRIKYPQVPESELAKRMHPFFQKPMQLKNYIPHKLDMDEAEQGGGQEELPVAASGYFPTLRYEKAYTKDYLLCDMNSAPPEIIPGARPNTLEAVVELRDVFYLSQHRHSIHVYEVCDSQYTIQFMDRIVDKWIAHRVEIEVEEDRCAGLISLHTVNTYITGIARILTLGHATRPRIDQASQAAHAMTLTALVYMMVIPFDLLNIVQERGEEYFDSVIYACRHRFRYLSSLSADSEFAELHLYDGNLIDMPVRIRELCCRFVGIMRHTGLQYWESNTLIFLPAELPLPMVDPEISVFSFVEQRADADWSPMYGRDNYLPPVSEGEVSLEARFANTVIELALLKNVYGLIDKKRPTETKTKNVDIKKFKREYFFSDFPQEVCIARSIATGQIIYPDMVTTMASRCVLVKDYTIRMLYTKGFHMNNKKLLDGISHFWLKAIQLNHSTHLEVFKNTKHWHHELSLSFEGIPYFFLGATAKSRCFRTCLDTVRAAVLYQLVCMMIIPQEMYQLVKLYGEPWIEIVIHACRTRFRDFLRLIANDNLFHSLTPLKRADLHPDCALFPLAETFFHRMRNTGAKFWGAHSTVKIPMDIRIPNNQLRNAYFSYEHSEWERIDWSIMKMDMEAPDYFEDGVLLESDRHLAPWEGDEIKWMIEDAAILPKGRHPGLKDKNYSETSCILEVPFKYLMPIVEKLASHDVKLQEAAVLTRLLEGVAGSIGSHLVFSATTEEVSGEQWIRVNLHFDGKLDFLIASTSAKPVERRARFRALVGLYVQLISLGILLPAMDKFILKDPRRLPFVLQAVSALMIRSFHVIDNHMVTTKNVQMTRQTDIQLIRKVRLFNGAEWEKLRIKVPQELTMTFEEQLLYPMLSYTVEPFDQAEQLEWRLEAAQRNKPPPEPVLVDAALAEQYKFIEKVKEDAIEPLDDFGF